MVEFDEIAEYKIMSVRSGKVLDVPKENINPGSQIHQWHYDEERNQIWKMHKLEDDYYSIISFANPMLCLEMTETGINALLKVGTNYENDYQKFKFEPVEDGSQLIFLIRNKATGWALAVMGASLRDKADVVQTWSDKNDQSQQWIVNPAY